MPRPSTRCARADANLQARILPGDAAFHVAANLFVHAAIEAYRSHRADDHRQGDRPLETPPATMDGPRENGDYPSLERTATGERPVAEIQ